MEKMTLDEAPRIRGGGMRYALQALLRRRLILSALALGVMLLFTGCADFTYKVHIKRGDEYMKTEHYSAAETEYREAIRLKPGDAEGHNNLGAALYNQGKIEEAIEAIRKAIELKPHYAEAHYNLGLAIWEQGRHEDAIEEYREAIRLRPDFAEAHYHLGYALADKWKYEEAFREYREAIRLKPDDPDQLVNLAALLDKQGKRKEAREYWERILKLETRPERVAQIKKRLAETD